MNRWKGIAFFVFGIVVQKLMYILYGMDEGEQLNFILGGVPVCGDIKMTCSQLIFWYFPISILFFAFSGTAKELIEGYAIYQVTRGARRWKLLLKKITVMGFGMFVLLLVNVLLMQNTTIIWREFLLGILLTALTIFFSLLLEFLLEFFLDSMVSVCIVQIWFVSSILIADIVKGSAIEGVLRYFLLPCFAFAERNGISGGDGLKILCELIILLAGSAIVILLAVRKYKRQDLV